MKVFLKGMLVLSIVVILLLSTGGALYWYNWQTNSPATADVEVSSVKTKIGEPIEVTVLVHTPWYRGLEGLITLETAGKAALSERMKSQEASINFSGYSWEIKLQLLLFEEGSFKDLKLVIPLSVDRQKKQKELTVTLPELQASLRGVGNESEIELKSKLNESALNSTDDELSDEPTLWIWLIAIALVVALIALVLMKKSRQKQPVVLPAWELAQVSLMTLKNELSLNDEVFFVRLSDILRLYIEKRFSLQATESTSEEFIREIRRDSVLSEKQRISLEKFLSTADLVKFARMNADEQQRSECLEMADGFVRETIPQAEGVS